MKPLNVLSKFENHFVNQTVCFQAQLEADGYFSDLPYFFLHPAESDVFSKVRVCEAKRSNESPSGAFKRRNGLAQQDGGTKSRQVPIWEKSNLTLEEAAAYSGIGINKLREMSDSKDCTFVLWNGTKRLLKRRRLDEHLDRLFSI